MSLVVLFFQAEANALLNEVLDQVTLAGAATGTVAATLDAGLGPVTLLGTAGIAPSYNPIAATPCWAPRRRAA